MKPKLTVLHQLAIQNSQESAARQREIHDRTAEEPPFSVGSKILIFDHVTRKGQCAKLCIRWRGPYLVTNSSSGYNYKLKDLKTGKDLKRLVHANRVRPLNELENDYGLIAKSTDVVLFETKTAKRRCTICVSVGDILATHCDIIVNPANSKLKHEGGLAKTITEAAGDEFLQECGRHSAHNEW